MREPPPACGFAVPEPGPDSRGVSRPFARATTTAYHGETWPLAPCARSYLYVLAQEEE